MCSNRMTQQAIQEQRVLTLIINTGSGWDELVTSLYYSMHTGGTHPIFTVRFVYDDGRVCDYTHQTFRVLGMIPLDSTCAFILIQETSGGGGMTMMSRKFDEENPPRTFAGVYNHTPAFSRSHDLPTQCLTEIAMTNDKGVFDLRALFAKILELL